MSNAKGGKSTLAWEQIAHLRETPAFYTVASAELEHKGLACRIANTVTSCRPRSIDKDCNSS